MIRNAEFNSGKSIPIEVFGIIYFILLVAAGIILVWQPAQIAQMNQEINRLEIRLQDLKMRNEDLKKQVASLESLTYIEHQARTRLGMVDPKEVKVFALSEDQLHSAAAQQPHERMTAQQIQEKKTDISIFSLFRRIAQIFGTREAVARGQR